MPDEYFFRGTIPQYWDIVYAEYQRLDKSLGREPFEFPAPHPHTQPLAEYVPVESSVIMITFWNTENTYEITVDAEFSPDREMVQVMVFYQGPFTKEGESALAMWKEVKRALEKDDRLIDMTKSVGKPLMPPKPAPGSNVFTWLDWRLQMKEAHHKCTLKQIAKEIPLSYGRVRYWNTIFMRQRAGVGKAG
jgi:hypothetical protein